MMRGSPPAWATSSIIDLKGSVAENISAAAPWLRQKSKAGGGAAAKVDALTIDERQKEYPDLPASLIGASEVDILRDLDSAVMPGWFTEVWMRENGGQYGPPSPSQWETYRQTVIQHSQEQVQKVIKPDDVDIDSIIANALSGAE
jgi:hypothetical protein